MKSCPVCGVDDTLVYYAKDSNGPDMIICTDFGDGADYGQPCGAQFILDRKSINSDWIKGLIQSSCKSDSTDGFPCPTISGNPNDIQCPSCDVFDDDDIIYDADARDVHNDVDVIWKPDWRQ